MKSQLRSAIAVPGSIRRFSTGALLLAGAVLTTFPAMGVTRYWIDTVGGSFGFSSNWSTTSGGAGGASFPVAGDTAVVDQSGSYFLTLLSDQNTSTLLQSSGNVTWDLGTRTYTVTSLMRFEGNANAMLRDGVMVGDTSGDDVRLGTTSSTATVTVGSDASLGTAALPVDLFVGYATSSRATLRAEDGGTVYAVAAYFGNSDFTTTTVSVSDPGSLLDLTSTMYIGYRGTSSFFVSNGGVARSDVGVTIGNFGGAVGSASVSGTGSRLDSGGAFYVGSGGAGVLTVQDGGKVSSASTFRIGNNVGSSGEMLVTGLGSQVDTNSVFAIGYRAGGVMEITNGGLVRSNNTSYIGDEPGATGAVIISGAGSAWEVGALVYAGFDGSADVLVSDGGRLDVSSSLQLGRNAGGTGELRVEGAGSTVLAGALDVGFSGTGLLRVGEGALVSVTNSLRIASTGSGELILDGGTVSVGDDFINDDTFDFRRGTLTVGRVFQHRGFLSTLIIDSDTSAGLATLVLEGDQDITNDASIYVGEHHNGRLSLTNGRTLTQAPGDYLYLASLPGSSGTVDVASGASITTERITIGGVSANLGGDATLNITSGGPVNADLVYWNPGGVINLDGGSLVGIFQTLDGQLNWTSGLLDIETTAGRRDTDARLGDGPTDFGQR